MHTLAKILCATVLGFTAMQSFAAPPNHAYAAPHAKHLPPPPAAVHHTPNWQKPQAKAVSRHNTQFPKHLQQKRFEVNYKQHRLPKPGRFEQWYKINQQYLLVNTRTDRVVRQLRA